MAKKVDRSSNTEANVMTIKLQEGSFFRGPLRRFLMARRHLSGKYFSRFERLEFRENCARTQILAIFPFPNGSRYIRIKSNGLSRLQILPSQESFVRGMQACQLCVGNQCSLL